MPRACESDETMPSLYSACEAMKEFAVKLSTAYANLCDHVIAPSESVARILDERGVHPPLSCIPRVGNACNDRGGGSGHAQPGRERGGA